LRVVWRVGPTRQMAAKKITIASAISVENGPQTP
jgi:hypothetical protein